MEMKVFTLPTCSICSVAKIVAFEVAQKYGVTCRVIDMATEDGLTEGANYQVMSAPSIVIDDNVVVRGQMISKERLEEEVKKRMEKWESQVSSA